MKSKRGIDIIAGFNVKSSAPIDNRIVCETIEEMENLKTAYDGLIVSCIEDATVYVRFNGEFSKWGGAASNQAFTYGFSLTLAKDENNENDYLIRT